MTTYKVDFESIPWETPTLGVRFKVHAHQRQQIRLVEFSPEFVDADWCRRGHVGYVVEGELEVDFNGKSISFSRGDGIFIPPGEAHRHRAKVRTGVAVLILVEES